MKDESKQKVKEFLHAIGYDTLHWNRTVMYRECRKWLGELDLSSLDVLEISAGPHWQDLPFGSYTRMDFPEYDICQDRLDQTFDLIIADQVFEHLLWPYRAAKNVYGMLRPGGYFLNTTPFLVRIHPVPNDCTRWTEQGMAYFLAECGFTLDRIRTDSWGNRNCVTANFKHWKRRGWFRSLRNEPYYPVCVWALAQKASDSD